MADREKLPDAPAPKDREKMAKAWVECAAYDGGLVDRSIRDQIKGGLLIFKAPDRVQMTKRGFDYLCGNS